jgi:hypothetical protein
MTIKIKKNKTGFELGDVTIKFDHPVNVRPEKKIESPNLEEHVDEGGGVTIDRDQSPSTPLRAEKKN